MNKSFEPTNQNALTHHFNCGCPVCKRYWSQRPNDPQASNHLRDDDPDDDQAF